MPANLFVFILFSVISASFILSCSTSIWGELWKHLKLSPVFLLLRHIRHTSFRNIRFCAFHDENYIFFLVSLHDRIRPLKSGLRSVASTLVLGHRHRADHREQHQLLLKWALWCDVQSFSWPSSFAIATDHNHHHHHDDHHQEHELKFLRAWLRQRWKRGRLRSRAVARLVIRVMKKMNTTNLMNMMKKMEKMKMT